MTDTTDIKALRERLVRLNRTYGLISSPATMEQANTDAHMFIKAGGINHILAALDRLEAERQRADKSDARIVELEKGEKYWFEEFKQAEAELADLKGDQVPVEEADYTRYSCGCCGFESLNRTTKCPECNYHKIESEPLYTAPQKPVALPEIRNSKYWGGVEFRCDKYQIDVQEAIEAAGGIVKDGE